MKRLIQILGIILACYIYLSCSKVQGSLAVLEGTILASQGQTMEAMGAYMKALPFQETAPYGEYGLGTLFLGMGETEAASRRFYVAEEYLKNLEGEEELQTHKELLYRIQYNRGLVNFMSGAFDDAAEAFKKALEVDSHRIGAKRNLELSLLALSRQKSVATSAALMEIVEELRGPQGLFDFIRQKESEEWKSRIESTEDTSVLDY